jgi:glycine cleavage system H protein
MSESYLPTHEWARLEGDLVVIGLSVFAAGEVGEVIHVELPTVGTQLARGKACAEIESVKSVNDYYSPIDGQVVEVNRELAGHPELVNADPVGKGWFAKLRPAGAEPLKGLLTAEQYRASLAK